MLISIFTCIFSCCCWRTCSCVLALLEYVFVVHVHLLSNESRMTICYPVRMQPGDCFSISKCHTQKCIRTLDYFLAQTSTAQWNFPTEINGHSALIPFPGNFHIQALLESAQRHWAGEMHLKQKIISRISKKCYWHALTTSARKEHSIEATLWMKGYNIAFQYSSSKSHQFAIGLQAHSNISAASTQLSKNKIKIIWFLYKGKVWCSAPDVANCVTTGMVLIQ